MLTHIVISNGQLDIFDNKGCTLSVWIGAVNIFVPREITGTVQLL